MKRTLRSTNTYLCFFIWQVPHYAIAKNCIYQYKNNKQVLSFDISSKAKLDVNNDGDFILNNIDEIKYIEISDEYYISNLEPVFDKNIQSEINILFPKNKIFNKAVLTKLGNKRFRIEFLSLK